MKVFLQVQDLWDPVSDVDLVASDVPKNDIHRKWKIKCGKALFILRPSISKDLIDHVQGINSPKEV